MYNCEWQKQFPNMTEMEPKQVKVYKNTEHRNSKVNIFVWIEVRY